MKIYIKNSNTKKRKLNNIKLSIFSPKDILHFSSGEIKNSETLNYKDFKPIKNGLFCDIIFGSKNKFCSCGNFFNFSKIIKICNVCKIEIIKNKLRRNKIGHIKLNENFINILFFKTHPNLIPLILNLSIFEIENILYNNYYLILYSEIDDLKVNNLINYEKYFYYFKKFNNKFYAETGFNALKISLSFIDLKYELKLLKKFFLNNKNYNNSVYKRNLKKYKIIIILKKNNNNLKDLFLKYLPVLHPDLRPIVKLSDDTIVSSDLNILYKKVIIRNNRLKYLKKNNFYNILYSNELKITQESIDNLFNNSSCFNSRSLDNNKRVLKSLSDNIKGKYGLFRQNILGKRVDYSGRSVIVSGPNLKLDECAIPLEIALELFRPFIYNKILSLKKYNSDINQAKLEVDKKTKFAIKILSCIIKNNFVLLNRAPTLHKLGMQSFKILLTNDKAIKLNPLVCVGFNADFDGDQMAVHIPLTIKSKLEYKYVLISTNNILHPANGECVITPTKDIILGLYYYTNIFYVDNPMVFFDIYSLKSAYNFGLINLNTRIFLRLKEFYSENYYFYNFYETNIARFFIFNILPKYISYSFTNKILRKNDISYILNFIYFKFTPKVVVDFSNNLMNLGFNFVTRSGISISIDDLLIDNTKYKIINEANNLIHLYNIQYSIGSLSQINKRKKILDLWETVYEIVSNNSIKKLFYSKYFLNSKKYFYENKNNIYYMADSGARSSEIQIKQICGMRGLINYKDRGMSEIPVLSNLREGLNILEYFFFSHNSRKSLADTALKTSNSGYLTRKLVEIVNNIMISEFDCFSENGLFFKNLIYNNLIIESLLDRLPGRFTSKDLYNINGDLVLKKNTLIDQNNLFLVKSLNLDIIELRSPITCNSKKGICSLCYGLNLSNKKLSDIGDTVGIIAAQSIGEPGTQLTMRTFHTGGVISKVFLENCIKSNYNGFIRYSSSLKFVINNNKKIVVSKIGKIKIFNINNYELCSFNVPYASTILIENNSYVNYNDIVCKWDSRNELIISDQDGYVIFENFFENLNFIKRFDEKKNIVFEVLNFNISNKIYIPFIKVCKSLSNLNEDFYKYNLIPGSFILFNDKDFIRAGDILIKNSISCDNVVDITGGLPRVIELFEARIPKNSALLSPIDGLVKFKYTKNNYRYLQVFDNNNNVILKKKILSKHNLLIDNNQIVNKGDILINGILNPHDILNIFGEYELINFLISEIKSLYYSQGVKINDKHIEVIIKQMLTKGIILDPGKSKFILGDIMDIKKILNINKNKFFNRINESIKFKKVLTGITKTSLTVDSFLSSASFQNTLSIINYNSIISKNNNINTLKENIMLGRSLVIGTGYYSKILNKKRCRL